MSVLPRRISVRAIVLHNNKLLCVRLKKYQGSMESVADYWCLPGGGLEAGESIVDGIAREMIEETGVKPVVGNLLYVQQFSYKAIEYMEFFIHVTNAEDYRSIDLANTSHGAIEIAEIGFVNPAMTVVEPKFLATEPLVIQAETGCTKFFSLLH